MNFSITTEYSSWFLLLCILLGGAYAFIQYFRENHLTEVSLSFKWMLALIRFSAVSLLAAFLINPLLKFVTRSVEKPIIILAQDASESLRLIGDSGFYKNELKEQLEQLKSKLEENYEVKTFSFGDKVMPEFDFNYSSKQTDISEVFNEFNTRFSNRNVGALILFSDGIYNKGQNPLYTPNHLSAPVFTVALGDTSIRKDLLLSKVSHNRITYLGNKFPIELVVEAKKLSGVKTRLLIKKENETVYSKEVEITNDKFLQVFDISLEAKLVGIQRYSIVLEKVQGETSVINNSKDIYIDVLDGRQKIILLADAPHPDVNALKRSIEASDNYEVTIAMASEFNKKINEYNLIILHQLPSLKNPIKNLLEDIEKSEIAKLFVIGNNTNLNHFNSLKTGVSITSQANKNNETQAIVTPNFPFFTLGENTFKFIKKYPPLSVPFGNYKLDYGTQVLLTQKVGLVDTKDPLIVFKNNEDKKTGVLIGEGFWRWRMFDYLENKTYLNFDELSSKIVQYLSVKSDKSLFRVICNNVFYEKESIGLDAELYNDSYELVNEAEVNLLIENQDKKKFPYVFNKTFNGYKVGIGVLPVGTYKYEATVNVNGKKYTEKGEFSVLPIDIESNSTIADHNLLYNLALKNGGLMIKKEEITTINTVLQKKEEIKPVVYNFEKLNELINLKELFFILIFLLSLEWFLRKRNGAY